MTCEEILQVYNYYNITALKKKIFTETDWGMYN